MNANYHPKNCNKNEVITEVENEVKFRVAILERAEKSGFVAEYYDTNMAVL